MRFFRSNRRRTEQAGPGINFLKYKLPDNVLYVNCPLTRPYCETKKAKAQREKLVGLAQADKRDVPLRWNPRREEKDFGLQKQGL